MRNRYLERMNGIVKIKIVGSNINSYLKRVIKKRIHIIQLIPISYKEIHVILNYSEYKKLLELKSIYEIVVLEYLGGKKLEVQFKKNFILFLFACLGIGLIVVLSRVVFSVDVIHQDSGIRKLIREELRENGIFKYTFKKNYQQLEEIENKILDDNEDVLEWIEISEYGTKYIVRIEERKLNDEQAEFQYQSIVSKKDAVLVKVEATSGEKVKHVNEYVSKGDTVISGYITRPDNTRVAVQARGTVYGEVWYEVNVDYPIVYQETNYTGNSKTVYALYFFGKRYGLFNFDRYRLFETKSSILVSSEFPSIKFTKEKQYEVVIKDEVYTEDIVKIKAIDYIKEKLMRDNSDIVEISDVKILDSSSDEDSVSFCLFVRAIENVGEVVVIEDVDKE